MLAAAAAAAYSTFQRVDVDPPSPPHPPIFSIGFYRTEGEHVEDVDGHATIIDL